MCVCVGFCVCVCMWVFVCVCVTALTPVSCHLSVMTVCDVQLLGGGVWVGIFRELDGSVINISVINMG